MCEGNKGLMLNLKLFLGGKVVVYGYCYQKVFGVMKLVWKVFGWILEFEFEIVDVSCCGMFGSFGLEVEYYEVLVSMGELVLLFVVCLVLVDVVIVVDGFFC